MRGNPPGTVMKQRTTWGDAPLPLEGDFLLFDSGACYRVLEVNPRREGAKSFGMVVVKMKDNEVLDEDYVRSLIADGDLDCKIHAMEWTSKHRR